VFHFTETYRASIPDPGNKLSLVSLISNPYVARELGLNTDVTRLLKQAEHENGGPLSINVTTSEVLLTLDELSSIHLANQLKWTKLCDEALNPAQWSRLRQLAFRIEVYRVGFGQALTAGRLGADVGVFENQKTRLSQRATQTERDLKQAIVEALAVAQESVLSELSSEQQMVCKERLGAPFLFRVELFQAHRRVEPENRLTLVVLLRNPSVAAELGLNEESLKVLLERLAANGGSLKIPIQTRDPGESRESFASKRAITVAQSERFADEALTPAEWKRLRELAYQIEVYKLGFTGALKSGFLGHSLDITEKQLKALGEKIQQIEITQAAKFVQIIGAAQKAMLAELSPEQRSRAIELLGKPFFFVDNR